MRMPSRTILSTLLCLSLASSPLLGGAADAPKEGLPHTLQLGSQSIQYRATWAETVLKDASGASQATISTISYVRTDLDSSAKRPVLFAFNGGPGASSSPLHTGVLGPRRQVQGADGKRTFIDNPETLLDVADLVLIDPVGTGFNKELTPNGNLVFLNSQADAKAAESVIRAWLTDHGRTESPIYIAGESYGGYRLSLMSKAITDLNIQGLVMISPAFDMTSVSGLGPVVNGQGNDLPYIFDFPTMAVTAWKHGKVGKPNQQPAKVFEEARAFAQTDFAAALQLGSELPTAQLEKVARRASALIGIPVDVIIKYKLRLPTQEFRELLLPGKVIGRVDTRVSAQKPDAPLVPGRSKTADDPALGIGKSMVIKSPTLAEYLHEATGTDASKDYISLSLNLFVQWDWRGRSPKFEDTFYQQASPSLLSFLEKKPEAKVLLLSGYYDLATPALAQSYSLSHLGVSPSRYVVKQLAGGHAVYDDSREETSAELHRFISGKQ